MNSIGSVMVAAFVVVAVAIDVFAAYHYARILRKWPVDKPPRRWRLKK